LQKPGDLLPSRHVIDLNLHQSRDGMLPWRNCKNVVNSSLINIFDIIANCNKFINKLENDAENYFRKLIQDVLPMN